MVANMVTKGNRVADIGCDHGHTSIYLVEHNCSKQIIAMDINQGPLARAKENIKRFHCEKEIDVRLSNGVSALKADEVDTILISGMGGALVIRILEEGNKIIENVDELILQPQSEISEVRRYLHSIGFTIFNEDMIEEDGKYYTAIDAKRGKEAYQNEVEYCYGKILLQKKNNSLQRQLTGFVKKHTEIIAKIKTQEYDKNRKRLFELQKEQEIMKEALKYFD